MSEMSDVFVDIAVACCCVIPTLAVLAIMASACSGVMPTLSVLVNISAAC